MVDSQADTKQSLKDLVKRFQRQIHRIDSLEEKLDERAVRIRRRVLSFLDSEPTHRASHLRLFVTHTHAGSVEDQGADVPNLNSAIGVGSELTQGTALLTEGSVPAPRTLSKLSPDRWTLMIEGRLLIGHLDHESQKQFDKMTGYTPPNDDLDRSRSEKEEEEFAPVNFTHLFDRLDVSFETVYQPPFNPAKNIPAKKKSRRGSKSPSGKRATVEESVDPRQLLTSPPTKLSWKSSDTEDAHAWAVQYQSAPPSPQLMGGSNPWTIHSVVARCELYPVQTGTQLFRVSATLGKALFPKHMADDALLMNRKRKAEALDDHVTPTMPQTPPLENQISMATLISMDDIAMAFFQYIQDRKLFDETEKSLVLCDKKLEQLLQVEQFSFGELQALLKQNNLIEIANDEPIYLTYIMKKETATNALPDPEGRELTPSLLQIDVDVAVKNLFPFRARELMRRIKRRELEYTSSRTKGRYLLSARRAKDEEDIKLKIDQVVAGHAVDEELQPVMMALARAAPPHTEARLAAYLDARTAYLLQRFQEHYRAAAAAWDVVGACRALGESDTTDSS